MKQTALAATLAGLSAAVSSDTMAALMQRANFGFNRNEKFDHNNPFGQTSNNDSDIKKDLPEFADPRRKGEKRPFEEAEHLPDDHVPIKVRNAQAAIRDPILAKEPDVRPLFKGSYDYEPIDYSNKKFLSPVFLVDPMFTDKMEDKKEVFEDNDFGGYKKPVSPSRWPIIGGAVQSFFGVGPDCTCHDKTKPVFAVLPEFKELDLKHYYTEPVYEPQYETRGYRLPANMYDTMYRGDDYGGHNIPFPHPCPPMPHSFYEQDAFIDLDKFFTSGRLGGYTMEPHGAAGWSADKAYKGDILMRYMPKSDKGYGDYDSVSGYGKDSYDHDSYGKDSYGDGDDYVYADNTGKYGHSSSSPYRDFTSDYDVKDVADNFSDFKKSAEGGYGNDSYGHDNSYAGVNDGFHDLYDSHAELRGHGSYGDRGYDW